MVGSDGGGGVVDTPFPCPAAAEIPAQFTRDEHGTVRLSATRGSANVIMSKTNVLPIFEAQPFSLAPDFGVADQQSRSIDPPPFPSPAIETPTSLSPPPRNSEPSARGERGHDLN